MNYSEIINFNPEVLVEFYASWCPHCKRMMPVVEQVKELLAGKVNVYQFDIDENEELSDREGVKTIPTFIIYRDGKEQWRQSGEMDGQVLLSKVEQYM